MRRLGAIFGLAFALALAFAQLASADGIDRTYVVGDEPLSMAVDPTDGRIFVGRSGGGFDRLVVIDPATGQVTTYVTSGTPNYLAIDPIHRRLYVSYYERLVDVFDLTTMTIEATLPVGGAGIAVDPATRRVYVAGFDKLWVIDGATNTAGTPLPALPYETWMAVAIDPALHHVYVTNTSEVSDGSSILVRRSLVILDDRDLSLVDEVSTDRYVRWGLAVDQSRHRVYLADNNASTFSSLAVLDGISRTLVDNVLLPGFAGGIALGADTVYVTAINTGYHVLDALTLNVRRSVTSTPFRPLLPVLHPDGRLYLSGRDLSGPDVVSAISDANHAPEISGISFNPSAPTTNDRLTLAVNAMDGDFSEVPSGQRDALTSTYEWARNGVVIAGESGSSLDLSRLANGEKGDTITGYVTLSDPEGLTASASRSVVIANAAPVVTVSLSDLSPATDDVLTAAANASDADGDPLTLTYQWLRMGAAIDGATQSSLDLRVHGDVGDSIEVRVTARDDSGGSAGATARALIIPTSGTFLYMRSEPGDYIGGGVVQLYTSANSRIWGFAGGGQFSAEIRQGNTHRWSVRLDAPFGEVLSTGAYPGAVRAAGPSNSPTMSFSGDGRGCNTLTGHFDIVELTYNVYGELMLIDATFEQHCEGAVPALFGRIRLEVPPPTPGVTLPQGTITVPTSGSFLYVHSEIDYAGGISESLNTSANSVITGALKAGGDYFRGAVLQGNVPLWRAEIASPPGETLAVGSYIRAVRAAFRPAGRPGVDLTGCTPVSGKFDVDDLVFAPTGELLVFQATFQLYCENSPLARHGRIRVEAAAATSPIPLPTGSTTPPVTGNYLYVNSRPGDFAGQGAEALLLPADAAFTGSISTNGDYMSALVRGNNGVWWFVKIAAPAGETLGLGSFVEAARADLRPVGKPGLEVTRAGAGCSEILGRFDVEELTRWPNGEIRAFRATFEQHCDYNTAALFGRFRFETSAPIALGLTIREEGSVTNKTIVATIKGTLACSKSGPVDLTGTLTQSQAKGVVVTGTFTTRVDCTAPSVAWSVNVAADSGKFTAGSASAAVNATACEPERPCVSTTAARSIKLNLGK
jgi:DNA-binding beta-propeller fold protein YncE